ncbi:MAG: hypothetical protein ACYTDV_12615 [Planctomycetota bacterium]|jgi:hypothetical protein
MKHSTNNGEKLPAEHQHYEIGCRKPPKEHQFKPGQSGRAPYKTNAVVGLLLHVHEHDVH